MNEKLNYFHNKNEIDENRSKQNEQENQNGRFVLSQPTSRVCCCFFFANDLLSSLAPIINKKGVYIANYHVLTIFYFIFLLFLFFSNNFEYSNGNYQYFMIATFILIYVLKILLTDNTATIVRDATADYTFCKHLKEVDFSVEMVIAILFGI